MSMRFSYFAIFGAMRTGSNLLERNLNQYENVECHGELFNPVFVGKAGQQSFLGMDLQDREANPIALIEKLKNNDLLAGFRIFDGHDTRVFDHALKDKECAKIVLRRHPLDSFVSLGIARKTDQWMLGNARKRKTAQIHFDIQAYRDYLARLDAFYADIAERLKHSGQTAFEISYDDLLSVEVMNGLIKFLGGQEERSGFAEKIKRQNPEPLSHKVSNHAEMIEQIGGLRRDAVEISAAPESNRGYSARDLIMTADKSLLFAPVSGVTADHVENWMQAQSSAALLRNQSLGQVNSWLDGRDGFQSFTLVAHPLTRAYDVFMRRIFARDGSIYPKIRERLVKHFGLVLPQSESWSVEDHAASFETFLEFLKVNLVGQTGIRIDADWEAQHKLVAQIAKLQPLGRVIRDHEFAGAASDLGEACKVTPRREHKYTLADIHSPRLEKLAKSVYAKDFRLFGFGDWSGN